MHARFLFVAILFSAPLIAAAFGRAHIFVRQTDDDCTNECAAWNNDPDDCNSTVVNDYANCLNCFIKSGSDTQADAQESLNGFVQDCDDSGTPVSNVTLTGNSAPSAGAGSTPLPKSTSTPGSPTHTTKPAEETSTDADDDSTATDASASASENATDSAASSSASAGASGAQFLKTGSVAGISAALAVLSVFVSLG
ncbi:hypothetical protein DFH08DRAFT_71268 [Mycena albidolilacea]|uniref:Uncharacterized protein n=1 Tax=Mycena albidolilacea TaxID=1033008 RepID=A0AAD6Z097_9AGAR|nr:hypothetical protein DFH08DRAFT_71268 [Mycena albidolilacea]